MFEFGTKAETLEKLKPFLKHSKILPQVYFTVRKWKEAHPECLAEARENFKNTFTEAIVRSSAKREDSPENSCAGAYLSFSSIPLTDEALIKESVNKVIFSYGREVSEDDQVLIQPFLSEALVSGVIFTRDIDTLAPYISINYDETSGRTNGVTSGTLEESKTLVRLRNSHVKDEKFEKLFKAIEEIESLTSSDCLDIEFAIDKEKDIYIFQVRPLALKNKKTPSDSSIFNYVSKIHKKMEKLNKPHPYLHGDNTIFGVMPDWNPAEMIGVKPRQLPLSLYKELITDRTWAYQRDNYGYKNLRSFPLIITFLGMPYVDVRTSFNSFIPKGLAARLSQMLINYYLNALRQSPHAHDKIEFDIIFSCYSFDMDKSLKRLDGFGFTEDDKIQIKEFLLKLTNNIVSPKSEIFLNDKEKIETLKKRQDSIISSDLSILEKIYWLIEDCKRYGTLPFAGLARAGFIAVQILRSLVAVNVFSEEDSSAFMASLETMAKKMARDRKNMPQDAFIEFYGHLRPGTYDILSLRYDEAYDYYFDGQAETPLDKADFSLDNAKKRKIDTLLKKEGFLVNSEELMNFLKEAIEAREYAKFIFTRSVSEILELVKTLGKKYELTTDEVSHIDIRTIMSLYSVLDYRELGDILKDEIRRNKNFYDINRCIQMPHIIFKPDDIYQFELEGGAPNFIGIIPQKAEIVSYENLKKTTLSGKIVFIPSADPGYDWIFTKKIAGLVTMYGGSNSHMAIRAAEMRIPSVIGAGEKNYKKWASAKAIEIDPNNKRVNILR